jgi:hypothetical protein
MTINYECPGANGQPSGIPITLATNATLLAPPTGINETNFFNLPCVINVGTNTVAFFRVTVTNGFVELGAPAPFLQQETLIVTVVHPCIAVTKQCVSATNTGNQVVITYSGTVTNCGDEILGNVQVFNNQPASNTLVLGPISLAPGAGTNFVRSYTNSVNVDGPFPDTLTAVGTGQGSGALVTDSASANCTISPALSIHTTNNFPSISWPTGFQAFHLEYAESLAAPINWMTVSDGVATNGSFKVFAITNISTAPVRFYRLRE